MTRLKAIEPEKANGQLNELFETINSKMGFIPNVMRTMGNSPTVLEGYIAFDQALSKSSIGNDFNELIALTVASVNGCDYCNAAHSTLANKLGLDIQSIELAREAVSVDAKISAGLKFVKEVVLLKGQVSTMAVEKVKAAGYDDAAIVEIIAAIAINVLTNYLNNVAETTLDFPMASPFNKH
ncbi:carboxymuconolactone decarboxylase family protein [Flavobacterium sp. 3-210]